DVTNPVREPAAGRGRPGCRGSHPAGTVTQPLRQQAPARAGYVRRQPASARRGADGQHLPRSRAAGREGVPKPAGGPLRHRTPL
ncbi:MAG: hypothetical protein AVDCRST_MAG39-2443, partial [uncultured Sphingomonadaceae bacterium]